MNLLEATHLLVCFTSLFFAFCNLMIILFMSREHNAKNSHESVKNISGDPYNFPSHNNQNDERETWNNSQSLELPNWRMRRIPLGPLLKNDQRYCSTCKTHPWWKQKLTCLFPSATFHETLKKKFIPHPRARGQVDRINDLKQMQSTSPKGEEILECFRNLC